MNRNPRRLRNSLFVGTTLLIVGALSLMTSKTLHAQGSWRGLVLAPEQRCAPYAADQYRYPQSLEDQIVAELGGVYAPYTGRWFASDSETDIEHMVARSEAHDSGLCAADSATKRRFAADPLNLTLAGPRINRYQKTDNDAAEWLPPRNRCWFAARVIAVRQRYGLTIDKREADALDQVLGTCTSTDLVVFTHNLTPAAAPAGPATAGTEIAEWDDNRNGRISCAEARAHGIAPVKQSHPAYPFMRDGDGDGVVCESGSSRTSSPPPETARHQDRAPTTSGRADDPSTSELRNRGSNFRERADNPSSMRMIRTT